MQRLSGIGVSPGIAAGRAVVLIQRTQVLRFSIAARRVERELARIEEARARSRMQLEAIRDRLSRAPGPDLAALFEAQGLMLDDPMLVPRAAAIVREQRVNAEWALQQVLDELAAVFDAVEDPYLRERKGDLADVVGRLRMNLQHGAASPRDLFRDFEEPYVLIADELTPSVAAQLDWTKIWGFATDAGSRTYHTAILARSLHVPAVVGLHDASTRVAPGAMVVVNGTDGSVSVDPPPEVVRQMTAVQADPRVRRADRSSPRQAVTADGLRIRLEANVDLPGDVIFAREQGAEGIGLFRSEFLLAGRRVTEVTEEVQYGVYRQLLEQMTPDPVTIRTFDVDEDQIAIQEHRFNGWTGTSDHPRVRLGLRAIRLSLKRRELLRAQLRAMLRAARHGDLRIMFPFVSGVEELREARAVLAEARAELEARSESLRRVPIGVMIEVPSAAFTADILAREVDFLTIGTNDLIQCCLAVDRTDDRVSHLYEPLHPAILRLIRHVHRAAARRGLPLSVCGEMASDPVLLALLVGLGLTQFSMTPAAIPVAQQVVGELDTRELRRIAAHVLRLSSAPEVEQYLADALGRFEKAERTEALSNEG